MDRRQIISMIGGAIAAASTGRSASLGAAAKIPRIGIIDNEPDWDAFRQELHDLNYTEGHTVEFEYRRADGMPERLAAAARELAQLPVDVIAVYGTPAAQAAQQASKSIPIVVIGVGDPAAAGLVTNFAHPGGNITGNTILGPDIVTKRLQVVRDAIPKATRLALLWNPNNVSSAAILDEMWRTTPLFGMSLTPFLSYGTSLADLFRRGARYADKILHGAKPGELPIEQPVSFGLVVNLKTARAIGVEFPAALLARADEVIE